MPRFVDTNVLLYAVSTDPAEARQRAVAEELFDSRDLALSAQVLGEFYVQATKPTRTGRLTHDQAATFIESMARYPIQALTYRVVRSALVTKNRFQISYWDAAILEAARAVGCREVLSEDLADGQDYGGVRVTNPFAPPS